MFYCHMPVSGEALDAIGGKIVQIFHNVNQKVQHKPLFCNNQSHFCHHWKTEDRLAYLINRKQGTVTGCGGKQILIGKTVSESSYWKSDWCQP